ETRAPTYCRALTRAMSAFQLSQGRSLDEFCDHLIVEELTTGETVGTYRWQTGQLAAANLGYYSEREFDFAPYETFRCELIELGRACVHAAHRNFICFTFSGAASPSTQSNAKRDF